MWFAPLNRMFPSRSRRRNQRPKAKKPRPLQLEQLETRLVPAGTWQALSNLAPQGVGSMILLSNGSVLTVDGGTAWSVLTPDSSGSYVNGTWSVVASSSVKRTFFGSAVLPDGRVMVLGGEYSSVGNDTNTGEIYDPVANTWTTIPNFPESTFGDGLLEVLPNGNVLAGDCCTGNSFIYSPGTNTWSTTGVSRLNGDSNNEEGWVKLAESGANGFGLGSGDLLSYEINGTSPQTGQIYVPATNTWISAGSVPVTLDAQAELGPSVLLPNGQVFWIGASNHTALYTPSTNFWAAGPDTPNDANGNQVGGFDAPAAVEPNGKVLYAASPIGSNGSFPGPTTIYEYDPSSNTTIAVPDTNGPGLGGPAFVDRMLVLPSGQVLFTNSGTQIWAYNPDSGPSPSWAPTISNLSSFFGTETLTGTQLNGLSEGASYGDDAQMASNYPIIELTDNNGTVRYARTFNWSDTGVATGSALVTAQFTMPAGAPNANLLNVIANGIPSANTLIVTGTGGNDTITLDTSSFFITVNVNGNTSSWFAPSVSAVYVDTGDGNDIINVESTFPGIPVTINESSGNTTVNISRSGEFLNNIQGDVFVNSGTGVNTLNVYDQNDPNGDTWTITGSTITRTGSAVVHYNGQSVIVINGGSGNLTYNVLSTEAFFSTSIDTGPGADTVNVQATGAFSTLTINNLFSTTNHDTVNIGSKAPSLSSTLANIAGTVNVANSSGGGTTLTVDDSGDTTGQLFFITSGQISGTAFPAGVINYNGGEVSSIHLLGGGGGNNFEVHSTASGTTTFINTDALIASTNNHVDISSNAPALGGTLANIAGPVNVSSSSGSTTLTVDDSGDTTGQTFTVTNNSITGTEFTGAINYSQVSALTFDGGSGVVDTYNVQSTAASTMTNLLLQGSSTVKLGSLAPSLGGTLANIAGPLNVSNASVMAVDDSGDSTAQTATITNNSISGTWSPAAITYANVGTLRIRGGFGGDTINVQSTASNTTTNLGLSGVNTVNVGNAGSVQGLAGALNIENPTAVNTIVLDDSLHNTSVATTVTLSTLGANPFNDSQGNPDAWGQIVGLAPANINYEYADTTGLTINGGGTRVHTWNILATGVATTINGGSGPDTFNVGSGGSTSTLDAIQGSFTVNGGLGTNILNVDDQGTPNGSYTVSSTVLSRLAPSGVTITYGTIKTVNLNTGTAGGATLTVLLSVPTTTVTYNSSGSSNTLVGANTANTWTITATNKGTLGKVAFTNVQNLVGGNTSDTFKFVGAAAKITGNLDGGAGTGTDKLDYSGNGGGAIAVNLQTGTAPAIGGTFTNINSLAGSTASTNSLTAANTYNFWSITGPNAGKVNTFSFTGIENLVGGSNVDVFKLSAAGTELSVNGGGAPAGQGDWLDYSGFASAVAVNLVTGSATNVNGGLPGSVTSIQNVHGGNALNTLTGDSQGNILIGGSAGGGTINGGTGSSLLIADKGGASVTGGSGGDILIADSTTFDTMTMANELALMSILAEWQSADSYADRFGDISKGSAHAGGSHFNGNNRLVWGTTVKDNGSPDSAATVTAAPSLSPLDWFFVDTNDIKVNYETGEHVDNT